LFQNFGWLGIIFVVGERAYGSVLQLSQQLSQRMSQHEQLSQQSSQQDHHSKNVLLLSLDYD